MDATGTGKSILGNGHSKQKLGPILWCCNGILVSEKF